MEIRQSSTPLSSICIGAGFVKGRNLPSNEITVVHNLVSHVQLDVQLHFVRHEIK